MDGWRAGQILFPGARGRLFRTLFCEPDRWWTVAELTGRTGIQPVSLRRQLAQMRSCGLLQEKPGTEGGLVQPDPASPFFPEMRTILHKLSNSRGTTETILIVEDQPATAQITRILLESWGYRVFEAHSATEATELFRRQDGIRLLLADVVLPDLTGPELARQLLDGNPSLRVIFMSGDPNCDVLRETHPFLAKPFNPAGLSRIVRKEFDRGTRRSAR